MFGKKETLSEEDLEALARDIVADLKGRLLSVLPTVTQVGEAGAFFSFDVFAESIHFPRRNKRRPDGCAATFFLKGAEVSFEIGGGIIDHTSIPDDLGEVRDGARPVRHKRKSTKSGTQERSAKAKGKVAGKVSLFKGGDARAEAEAEGGIAGKKGTTTHEETECDFTDPGTGLTHFLAAGCQELTVYFSTQEGEDRLGGRLYKGVTPLMVNFNPGLDSMSIKTRPAPMHDGLLIEAGKGVFAKTETPNRDRLMDILAEKLTRSLFRATKTLNVTRPTLPGKNP